MSLKNLLDPRRACTRENLSLIPHRTTRGVSLHPKGRRKKGNHSGYPLLIRSDVAGNSCHQTDDDDMDNERIKARTGNIKAKPISPLICVFSLQSRCLLYRLPRCRDMEKLSAVYTRGRAFVKITEPDDILCSADKPAYLPRYCKAGR